ncbi:hypothetical protein ACTXG7_22740 [Mycolicibacterium sp. Dal123E01]|uniref:hypothetical protein n=1 Tax=Mycolicibacterium sp. Dal123E01 TaxID=3457578 RepID=UPI00403E5F23
MTTDDNPDTPDPEVVEAETTAVELSDSDVEGSPADEAPQDAAEPKKSINWAAVVAFGLLPILALLLGAGAGYLKWENSSRRDADRARTESVQAAKDGTVVMLTYKYETVEPELNAARSRLTGDFQTVYTDLINKLVIPAARERKISAVTQVPAGSSVSATADHAVVLLFVNQTVVEGTNPPNTLPTSVRVTLDKVHDHWLIAGFEPI